MTMVLEANHLEYPRRHYGMDHELYEWTMLTDRSPVAWPGGKLLAVWINVSLQHFPLNPTGKPVKLPGSMAMPYPDLRHYTLRDYGNRVGIYRFLEAFGRFGIKPSFAVNACLAERYPQLLDAVLECDGEILGHSWSMDTPHAGGLDRGDEAALVERSLTTLRERAGSCSLPTPRNCCASTVSSTSATGSTTNCPTAFTREPAICGRCP
jgi:allantoinase